MNHPVASSSVARGIAMLMGAGVVRNEYLRTPPIELLQLPADLIPLDSPTCEPRPHGRLPADQLRAQTHRTGAVGHISPIAAYHAPSDRLLILDVAANKYPPIWVRVQEVWDAMNAPLNAEISITRGFVVVHGVTPARYGMATAGMAPADSH